MKNGGALETLFEKDAMVDVLERIRDLFIKEAAKLRTRRNREHSPLGKLPQEPLVEILLLSVGWKSWSVGQLQTLARVSTSWRDTILSCNRFWLVVDTATSSAAREVAMKRNRGGLVDLRCRGSLGPSALTSFMHDIQRVQSIRAQSVLYELGPETSSFLDHLQSDTSTFIDLLLSNHGMRYDEAYLELSSEGPNLRHLDLHGTALQWESLRLTNLRTLCLRDLRDYIPGADRLYTILSSYPELERLCLVNLIQVHNQGFGSVPASSPPVNLPVLQTLAFDYIPVPISVSILPLIRASACHTVIIREEELPVALEPQETTIELIAKAISLSESLTLKLDVDDGACLHFHSEPVVAREYVYWASDQPGVDVKLAILSTEVLPQLWNFLGNMLGSHGGAPCITSLQVKWDGQEYPFPFKLLEHCTGLTSLKFINYSGTTLQPLIEFLRGNRIGGSADTLKHRFPLPSLTSLKFYVNVIPDLEECVRGTKDLLERRYPAVQDGLVASDVQVMNGLHLPSPVVRALRERGVATSLDLKKVIHRTKVGD